MIWSEVTTKLALIYGTAAAWVYDNPVETDVIIGLCVAGSLLLLTKRARRMQRRAHRLLWGALMKRKDREKYQKMKLEDAIVDCVENMVHEGDMTPTQAIETYTKMGKSYDLVGLMPGRDQASVKRGILYRFRTWYYAPKKVILPGAKPGEGVEVDPNYKPEFAIVRRGLDSSKYATEK